MNMGGDDFIAKPIDLNVMTYKLQAILRRAYDMSGSLPFLEYQGAVLNLNNGTLDYNGKSIELTKNEFRILQTLMENKGKVVSRERADDKAMADGFPLCGREYADRKCCQAPPEAGGRRSPGSDSYQGRTRIHFIKKSGQRLYQMSKLACAAVQTLAGQTRMSMKADQPECECG